MQSALRDSHPRPTRHLCLQWALQGGMLDVIISPELIHWQALTFLLVDILGVEEVLQVSRFFFFLSIFKYCKSPQK